MTLPPPLPRDGIYTSCYCEENIYLLCRKFLQTQSVKELWDVFVVFISNDNKMVALWCQKAARFSDSPVIWDYHVILILRPQRKERTTEGERSEMHSWVYDFDTTLDLPHPWEEYFSMTFPEDVLPVYESQFRVVGGELYIQHFASDRSHMLLKVAEGGTNATDAESGIYSSPPPIYAPVCGPSAMQQGVTNNLMLRYVTMSSALDPDDAALFGVVLGRESAEIFFEEF